MSGKQTFERSSVEALALENLHWEHFDLSVTDLERSTDFWTTYLGLHVRHRTNSVVELGSQKRTLIVLHSGASRPVPPEFKGMSHLAIGVPDQSEFSRVLARLIAMRVPVTPVEHPISKSIYITDPDGFEIEFTLETVGYDKNKTIEEMLVAMDRLWQSRSGREPLDVSQELGQGVYGDVKAPLSEDCFLAHLHLKVANVEAALCWFDEIGFFRNPEMLCTDMVDMGTSEAYSHRVAMDQWTGPKIDQSPPDMAGLKGYCLGVRNVEDMKAVGGLKVSGADVVGLDPFGLRARLRPRSDT